MKYIPNHSYSHNLKTKSTYVKINYSRILLDSSDLTVMPGGPGAVAQVVKGPCLLSPGSHMGTGSNHGSPASLPAPCLWPGKTVEDGPKLWDPAPTWQTQKKLLAPGLELAQFWLLRLLGE